jgi:hypothetical protein
MKVIAIATFLALVQTAAFADELLELRMATLALQVPATWRFTGTSERAEGKGPDGEYVIASYRKLKRDAPSDVIAYHWKAIRGFAKDKMPDLAVKNGEVVVAVSEKLLPGGRVQFSAMSQGKKMLRDYYFLQYLLGSSQSLVYITVEGYGSTLDAAARFEAILATQRWEDEP